MNRREAELLEVLSAFASYKVSKHLILVGSWSLYVYKEKYNLQKFNLVTSDIDFAILRPHSANKVSSPKICEILEDLGYEPVVNSLDKAERYLPRADITGKQLFVEFLCAPGRHAKGPYEIKGLGVTATPVRFQQVLVDNTEIIEYQGVEVRVTLPAFWAAHKIAISQIREGSEKAAKETKDIWSAEVIVNAIGPGQVLKAAESIGGKFVRLFEKGWKVISER
ncbi:MAG: GSU2403 family nucleotidyltransferase fold protein [Planctomycetota bacterium]|jgi:hypothetical protein